MVHFLYHHTLLTTRRLQTRVNIYHQLSRYVLAKTHRRAASAAYLREAVNEKSVVNITVCAPDGREKSVTAKGGDHFLNVAQSNGINLVGACNADLRCSTCHIIVDNHDSYKSISKASNIEKDLLESAWGVENNSRLSCQVFVTPEMEGMRVRFPGNKPDKIDPETKNSSDELFSEPIKSSKITDADIMPSKVISFTGKTITPRNYKVVTKRKIKSIFEKFMPQENNYLNWATCYTAASILPFRTNMYVVEELIDWNNIPNDPIFQLTFPQEGMLEKENVQKMKALLAQNATALQIRDLSNDIREGLNPHPAKQKEMNIPQDNEGIFDGLQHKYRETVLYFPKESQYCHAYCTYCFRWAQFVGQEDLQFASTDSERLQNYLKQNQGIKDLLLTGGDPMVMSSNQLARYIEPLLTPEYDFLRTIRIGTKSISYWPYRYVTDSDADETLRLFEKVTKSEKQLAIMAHYTHPNELQTDVAEEAIRRIRMTGAQIRTQAPLVQHVNDDPEIWSRMWNKQVSLGLVPYYMFVERDTGPKQYFRVPLTKAVDIYNKAYQKLSGLARTVRGPSMSATPGKVHVIGTTKIGEQDVFILKFIQSRNPTWIEKPFFAKFDAEACWLDELKPAFGDKFFYEDELLKMESIANIEGSSGQLFQPKI